MHPGAVGSFLIVAGGEPPAEGAIRRAAEGAACVIAADRGAWYCLRDGIVPHLVVGDMDSLPSEALEELHVAQVEVLALRRDKDETDTQIALQEALKRGARSLVILAALGTRFDHGLANVQLLHQALRAGVPAHILAGAQDIFLIEGQATLADAEGCTVSLLPLGMCVRGVTLAGFVYPLHEDDLEVGYSRGISNVVRDPLARVEVREGILIAVLTQDAPGL